MSSSGRRYARRKRRQTNMVVRAGGKFRINHRRIGGQTGRGKPRHG